MWWGVMLSLALKICFIVPFSSLAIISMRERELVAFLIAYFSEFV